jgi:signal transduction histidine kinase
MSNRSARGGARENIPVYLDRRALPVRSDSARPAFVRMNPMVKTTEDQLQRMALLGALAAGAAHEVNNLMTVVLGSLALLRPQPLDGRGRELLRRAEWGAQQTGRLAQQMLSFARREGQEKVVDLNETVGGFDKMMALAAGGRNIELAVELTPQPLRVRLKPEQLELALLNLVRNATDAMAGSGRIGVHTSTHLIDSLGKGSTVEVAVTDTGPGMPAEVVKHATDSFFTTKEPGRGTGLGLWMVHRFVASCGGKLAIETAVGHGTTVRLLFPQAG